MSGKSLIVLAFYLLIALALPSCGSSADKLESKYEAALEREKDLKVEIRELKAEREELAGKLRKYFGTIERATEALNRGPADARTYEEVCEKLTVDLDTAFSQLGEILENRTELQGSELPKIAKARWQIAMLSIAIERYFGDFHYYPADQFRKRSRIHVSRETNLNLVECLNGDGYQPPFGRGKEDDNGKTYYVCPEELVGVDGAYLDPWGNPLYYRENLSKKYTARHNFLRSELIKNWRTFDLWSAGPDGETNMENPRDPVNKDDIGNW